MASRIPARISMSARCRASTDGPLSPGLARRRGDAADADKRAGTDGERPDLSATCAPGSTGISCSHGSRAGTHRTTGPMSTLRSRHTERRSPARTTPRRPASDRDRRCAADLRLPASRRGPRVRAPGRSHDPVVDPRSRCAGAAQDPRRDAGEPRDGRRPPRPAGYLADEGGASRLVSKSGMEALAWRSCPAPRRRPRRGGVRSRGEDRGRRRLRPRDVGGLGRGAATGRALDDQAMRLAHYIAYVT